MIQKIKTFLITSLLLTPTITLFAGDFVPLSVDLPSGATTGGIFGLLNYLFTITIGVVAILAVIMLTIGGFKYMTSESVFNLGNAKEQMTNAIVGLLIVLVAVLFLEYINPDIVEFNFLK